MILLIDNYDSFTYNLYQFIGTFNNDIKVVRNDKITIEEIEDLNPESIVISPGPKSPKEAGICLETIILGERSRCLESALDISVSERHLVRLFLMQRKSVTESSL